MVRNRTEVSLVKFQNSTSTPLIVIKWFEINAYKSLLNLELKFLAIPLLFFREQQVTINRGVDPEMSRYVPHDIYSHMPQIFKFKETVM